MRFAFVFCVCEGACFSSGAWLQVRVTAVRLWGETGAVVYAFCFLSRLVPHWLFGGRSTLEPLLFFSLGAPWRPVVLYFLCYALSCFILIGAGIIFTLTLRVLGAPRRRRRWAPVIACVIYLFVYGCNMRCFCFYFYRKFAVKTRGCK